jgi:1-acyl-sn-glycerol-3-phosphate acyltransferase
MLSRLSSWLLKILGWTVHAEFPETGKYVLIVAPHTSNWDFPLGILAKTALKLDARWMGKHTLFHWPAGWFFRALGGVPVRRDQALNMIQQMADLFAGPGPMVLALAPEGTRIKKDHWKTGFYHIARAAQVPIAMAYLDYENKEVGLGGTLYPSDDISEVFVQIREFYRNRNGKYREQQSLIQPREKPPSKTR